MKSLSILTVVLSVIGVACLLGALFFVNKTKNYINTAQSVPGVVTDLIPRSSREGGYTYVPKFEFIAENGQKYVIDDGPSANPPAYSRGEQIIVLYQTGQEQEARIKGFFSLWFGALFLGIFGSVFAVIGFSMMFFSVRKNRKNEHLKINGQPLMTQLQGVERNRNIKVNNKYPWQIVCQWQNPRDKKLHVFKSDYIWFDPTDYIQDKTITVLVDRENYKKYYVDISFLPELAD